MNLYILGGSPCSGKSTVAEILSRECGLTYFKVDENLERYIDLGAKKGYPICQQIRNMTPEQTWMRSPEVQNVEEFECYREIFEFVMEDLQRQEGENVITEAAAYLPELMKQHGISWSQYLALTPTKEFQVTNYSKRKWVPYVLEGCSDKEQAFRNWMDRDALFAEDVRKQCEEMGYVSIVNDGSRTIDELVAMVCEHFKIVR